MDAYGDLHVTYIHLPLSLKHNFGFNRLPYICKVSTCSMSDVITLKCVHELHALVGLAHCMEVQQHQAEVYYSLYLLFSIRDTMEGTFPHAQTSINEDKDMSCHKT